MENFNHECWCDTQNNISNICNCIVGYPLKVIDDQQTKIETLLAENKILRAASKKYEACRSFYGDIYSWDIAEIDESDIQCSQEINTCKNKGGKLARQTAKDENVIAALKLLRGEE